MKPIPSPEQLNYFDDYDDHYEKRSVGSWVFARGHKLLESTLPDRNRRYENVIEAGAGTGHHFRHVTHDFGLYRMTDASDQVLGIARRKFADVPPSRLSIEKQDAAHLTYPDHTFDRLIATHVLEHLPSPVGVLEEWDRVVKPGGVLSILLPCDPGMLWRFGRHLGPRRQAEARGLAYDYMQAGEHINAIFNLVTFIQYHFPRRRESWWPTGMAVPDINLFYACHLEKA